MARQAALDKDECVPEVDFASGSFTTPREPLKDLITTFSDLYIDSEDESEDSIVDGSEFVFPPPPPPTAERETFSDPVTNLIEQLTNRFNALEGLVDECVKKMSGCVSQEEFQNKCQGIEDRLVYRMERERERVKNVVEMSVQDLGRSMVDCLKRRDGQLEAKFKSITSITTPVTSKIGYGAHDARQSQNYTYEVQQSSLTSQEKTMLMPYNPPVKLDFPCFSNRQDEDPILFVERCEEYFAVRPLNDQEILASLNTVLKETAKDWWQAERRKVHSWGQFKDIFLRSFLSEDYEDVASRRLVERKQGAKESIRDFAFHYRALCLRWRKNMSEKDIVLAILRNCNPRLASLLRGTITNVGELVRIGTQIERDFDEAKKYWNQVNSEEQNKKKTYACKH